MKKISILALVVLAGASWACRKNVAEPENPYADAPWAIDESLPVPIQFGMDSSTPFGIETKAAPIETANFADAKLKITAVDMNSTTTYTTSKGFLFYDAPATVSAGFIQFLDGEGEPITRYYPQVSKAEDRLNYSFIGYQVPDEEIQDPGSVHPPLTRTFYLKPNKSSTGADNNVDILWARSDAEDIEYESVTYHGYNAQYIRKARLAGTDVLAARRPNLAFAHKAAVAHFVVRGENLGAATDETYTYEDENGDDQPIYTVKDLKVAVRREQARLDMTTGLLSYYGSNVSGNFRTYDSFAAYDDDYVVPVENAADTPDGIEFGTGVFLIPGARTAGTDDLQLQFTLVNNLTHEEDTYGVTTPISLPLPYLGGDPANGTGYDAGTSYTYYITVNSAAVIRIQASVANWNSYTGDYVGDAVVLE